MKAHDKMFPGIPLIKHSHSCRLGGKERVGGVCLEFTKSTEMAEIVRLEAKKLNFDEMLEEFWRAYPDPSKKLWVKRALGKALHEDTFENIMAGLDDPTVGTLRLRGEEAANRLGTVGYMQQKDLLLPWRSVLDNAILGLEIQGVSKREARDRASVLMG